MEELEQLKELGLQYARGIWNHRWIAIAIAWLVLICGIIVVDQIKSKYKAETKVYIDSTSMLGPLIRGLSVESDFETIVSHLSQQLFTRPNLLRVLQKLGIDTNVNGEKESDALLISIFKRLDIEANKKTGIYTLTFIDTDRVRARNMVQALLDIFLEDTLDESITDSDSAIEFLNRQIDKYDSLLREAEDRREDFKRKNIGLMPKDGNNYYAQLQSSATQLEEAELNLSELRNRRDKIKLQIRELESVGIGQGAIIKTGLDERIEEQESRLDELLLLYTDEHPDVINSREVLNTLRSRKEQEVTQRATTRSILDNPVYQELQILLSKTEADISSVDARFRSLRKKQAELKKLVDIVPKVEAELQRLNRDYQVHKKNYAELVSRREKARISEDVESGVEQVKFRVIEPPYVPTKAEFPNRPLFDVGVLLLAIGTGYGISLLISLLQPVFYNQKDLAKHIGRAVLGSVSKFDTPNVLSKRRKNLVLFVFANLSFLCVGGILIFLHAQGIFILSQLKSMVM